MIERRDPVLRRLPLRERSESRHGAVGFTGAPGTGKSTLVDSLVSLLRRKEGSIAVLATDPNSPFTGGAILGDRVRMQRHALDPNVFIRSMGARGHLGGLSIATREAVRVLFAFGFDEVILETVGVGQSELEVAAVADTTVVVLTPNLGDGVQMIKAGILEIADVFCVNKADLDGHSRVVTELRSMLNLAQPRAAGAGPGWKPPIVPTVAANGEGVEALWAAVLAHRVYLESSGLGPRRARQRLEEEAVAAASEIAQHQVRLALAENPSLAERLARERTPYQTAEEILRSGPIMGAQP